MVYYELLKDGTIGRSTNNANVAQQLGLTLATDEEIVCGYDGKRYLKTQCPAKPKELVAKEQLAALEAETGLIRAVREMVLAEDSGASDYVRAKAQEIEDLAKQLREEDGTGVL